MSVSTPRRDTDLLIELLRRSPLLKELERGPLDRGDIQERLGVSRATSHRHVRRLRELGVIEKVGDEFHLTESGKLVARAVIGFEREALSALRLAPVLEAVQHAPVEVDVERFVDATITTADTDDPYGPLRRFATFVDGAERLRGVDTGAIAPLYLDETDRRIQAGMETDVVARPAVVARVLDTYPERYVEPCATGHLQLRLRDDLPFSVVVLDDRVMIAVRWPDDSSNPVFVDTDDPDLYEWAVAVFEAYRSESVRMNEYTGQEFDRARASL